MEPGVYLAHSNTATAGNCTITASVDTPGAPASNLLDDRLEQRWVVTPSQYGYGPQVRATFAEPTPIGCVALIGCRPSPTRIANLECHGPVIARHCGTDADRARISAVNVELGDYTESSPLSGSLVFDKKKWVLTNFVGAIEWLISPEHYVDEHYLSPEGLVATTVSTRVWWSAEPTGVAAVEYDGEWYSDFWVGRTPIIPLNGVTGEITRLELSVPVYMSDRAPGGQTPGDYNPEWLARNQTDVFGGSEWGTFKADGTLGGDYFERMQPVSCNAFTNRPVYHITFYPPLASDGDTYVSRLYAGPTSYLGSAERKDLSSEINDKIDRSAEGFDSIEPHPTTRKFSATLTKSHAAAMRIADLAVTHGSERPVLVVMSAGDLGMSLRGTFLGRLRAVTTSFGRTDATVKITIEETL